METMSLQTRIEELGARHSRLEREIDDEIHRPMADSIRLHELKREKLRVKEEIEALRITRH